MFERESSPQINEESHEKDVKQLTWEHLSELADKEWGDALGKGIDRNVKDAVVAFNALDIPTTASCEGHDDWGIGAPWVEIEAPQKPDERFTGQKEVTQKIAEKYSISYEDVVRANNEDAWLEMQREIVKNEETPEYRQWKVENEKLMDHCEALLVKFYSKREVGSDISLVVERGEGSFRVHNGGADYCPVAGLEMTDEVRREFKNRLKQYQDEMEQFGQFLKAEFFHADTQTPLSGSEE